MPRPSNSTAYLRLGTLSTGVVALAPVRVLLDYRPALRARTGIGEYVHELVKALVTTAPPGASVAAFSSSWKDRVSAELCEVAPGVEVVDRRWPVRGLTWGWHRWGWPPVERLAGRCDVVHSPTPLLVPASRAAQVVTVFDLHFLTAPTDVADVVRRDFVELAASHVARADHVIAGSDHAGRLLRQQLGLDGARITVTPLGAPAWAAGVRARRGENRGRHLLFIGTLEPRKNLGLVFDACARLLARGQALPPLVVAGQEGTAGDAWRARAREAPLAGHVSFAGYVDAARREALFAEARAVVVPSLEEGFGLPALEAMACGVPVIAAPVGSLPDVMGGAGLFAPLAAPDAWADAITRVLDDGVAEDLARRGLARASAFSWTATATATWRAYDRAIAARASRTR